MSSQALWFLIGYLAGGACALLAFVLTGRQHFKMHFYRLPLGKGDVGILVHPEKISREARERIRAEWLARFPENDVLVLAEGMDVGVVAVDEATDAGDH